MTVEIGADGKPKAKRKGTFTKETAKAARSRSGKGKSTKGLAVKVRKHRDEIVAGMLEIARKSKSETARARMWDSLARIGWGAPASAAEMGTIERPDGQEPQYGDVPGRHATGVIILPAIEPDWSKLTDEEIKTLERLATKCGALGLRPELDRPSIAEQLAEGRRQSDEWFEAHLSPATASTPAPSESPTAIENASPTQPHDGADVIPMFPAPPTPAGLDTMTNDRLWPGKEASDE